MRSLDLTRAAQIKCAAGEVAALSIAGNSWQRRLIPDLYGTALGQVPAHFVGEDAVVDATGSITALVNRGGGGSAYSASLYVDGPEQLPFTRSGGLINCPPRSSAGKYGSLDFTPFIIGWQEGHHLLFVARQTPADPLTLCEMGWRNDQMLIGVDGHLIGSDDPGFSEANAQFIGGKYFDGRYLGANAIHGQVGDITLLLTDPGHSPPVQTALRAIRRELAARWGITLEGY